MIVALVAAVKNSCCSRCCASALPTQSDASMRPELWHTMISDCLLNVPSSGQFDELIQDRLTAQGKRHSLRPFQRDVAARASDVTLVKAGCGSGKTLAAYHWAQVRCSRKRLYVCYPTTGTTTEGFRDYVFDKDEHQPKYARNSSWACVYRSTNHSRNAYDESVDDDAIARIRSLQRANRNMYSRYGSWNHT